MSYFSEREKGESPRDSETIGEGVWGGIQALLAARVEDGSFGATYPLTCDDGRDDFRETVNRIFRRNGLAYELGENRLSIGTEY